MALHFALKCIVLQCNALQGIAMHALASAEKLVQRLYAREEPQFGFCRALKNQQLIQYAEKRSPEKHEQQEEKLRKALAASAKP